MTIKMYQPDMFSDHTYMIVRLKRHVNNKWRMFYIVIEDGKELQSFSRLSAARSYATSLWEVARK